MKQMRRGGAFWGVLLIVVGGLFMLNTLGLLTINIGKLIFPAILVLLGLWVLVGNFAGPATYTSDGQAVNIPLEGAERARVRLHHGAGRLRVSGTAPAGQLVDGTFGAGVDYDVRRDGPTLDVDLRGARDIWQRMFTPWNWWDRGPLDWDFAFNGDVPLDLSVESGASETRLDLSDLRVTDLKLQTGMSATEVTLPAKAGHTRAKIRAGMAEVKVFVPEGVAARIRATGGLADISVNEGRFPRSGDVYQSPDYDTSERKVEIDAETGMGALKIT
jgi:hypothetical protein